MTVWRTPGFRSNNTHYTYTNSVVINNLVLLCRFNGFDTQNAQARAVFEQAFEDKTIVQVDCSSIISLSGAIHCIVMHVPRMIEGLIFRNGFEP
jgi:agmatine/peptidylarginine deiminase